VIDRDRKLDTFFNSLFERNLTMKRNLIAVALAVLGLANVAVADPTLQMYVDDSVRLNAPEATSYQAATGAQTRINEQDFSWNP